MLLTLRPKLHERPGSNGSRDATRDFHSSHRRIMGPAYHDYHSPFSSSSAPAEPATRLQLGADPALWEYLHIRSFRASPVQRYLVQGHEVEAIGHSLD